MIGNMLSFHRSLQGLQELARWIWNTRFTSNIKSRKHLNPGLSLQCRISQMPKAGSTEPRIELLLEKVDHLLISTCKLV
jgi:hypothetical protein